MAVNDSIDRINIGGDERMIKLGAENVRVSNVPIGGESWAPGNVQTALENLRNYVNDNATQIAGLSGKTDLVFGSLNNGIFYDINGNEAVRSATLLYIDRSTGIIYRWGTNSFEQVGGKDLGEYSLKNVPFLENPDTSNPDVFNIYKTYEDYVAWLRDHSASRLMTVAELLAYLDANIGQYVLALDAASSPEYVQRLSAAGGIATQSSATTYIELRSHDNSPGLKISFSIDRTATNTGTTLTAERSTGITTASYNGNTKVNEVSIAPAGVLTKLANGTTTNYILPSSSGTLALQSEVAGKQDALVSGQNIKSINGQSVLGAGNMTIHEEQLIEKSYAPAEFSGLGRKYLQKNIVDVSGTDKNVLTQAMMNDADTIYVIQYDYDLNGQSITVPSGCVFEFDGGSIKNGTLNASDVKIEAASEKIFDSIQGSINTKSIIDCRWFGDNCSDINDIIGLFGACHIVLRGNFVHNATVVVPYDVQIDAKDAVINSALDAPIMRLYAGLYDINLDGLIINVSAEYTNNVVEVYGSSNPNISGYNLLSDYQPITINLPKVYGATQQSARDDHATAYYISSSNTGKDFYEHLYFTSINGAVKNLHRAMRVDLSDGEFNSNIINLKCWWCPIGLSSNIHFNDSCKINILYQCNSYSTKLIQCDSTDYYSGGADYHLDIWDEQFITTIVGFIENTLKGRYSTSFSSKPSQILLNKYFLYSSTNTTNDNALTYNTFGIQGLSKIDIDDQFLLRVIERDGIFGTVNNQSCILNLVDYTNKNFLKTTTYTIVYGGNRFTPSSVIGWFRGFLNFDKSGIFTTSRLGYIEVKCIVPNFTTSSSTTRNVSNVEVIIYEEQTTQEAKFYYEIIYTNTSQKAYIRLLKSSLYNGTFTSDSAANGSTITNFIGGVVINDTIYEINSIGKNPICKFVVNSYPSEDQEITINLFGDTITFNVTECSSVSEFVGKLAWGIDRNASGMHITDMSNSYLSVTSDLRFSASLTSYTITGNGIRYATGASGGSWGKPNNIATHRGTTANRPTLTSTGAGFTYWDTDLGKMIAWNGSVWVNLDGTALT